MPESKMPDWAWFCCEFQPMNALNPNRLEPHADAIRDELAAAKAELKRLEEKK